MAPSLIPLDFTLHGWSPAPHAIDNMSTICMTHDEIAVLADELEHYSNMRCAIGVNE